MSIKWQEKERWRLIKKLYSTDIGKDANDKAGEDREKTKTAADKPGKITVFSNIVSIFEETICTT